MKQTHYDYLVVGAGLTGAVFADAAKQAGKSVLVIESRDHIAGNVYTEATEGIHVHKYGAHIFHTSLEPVWRYVNKFAQFNNYINCPVALYKGTIYNMPFNMNTFSKMWGVVTPDEALAKINEQRAEITGEPKNLEEQAISLVGRDIFEALVKGYTEKQWGRDCKDLPASIIKRLPVRLTYDNNYFNDRYQGIPMGGYTKMVANMFGDTEILLNTEYREFIAANPGIADRIIYCGTIDGFYNFELGTLEYRSLRFETERIVSDNWQGNAVVNYNEREVPWTRIIEHKHFEFCKNDAGEEVKDTEGNPVTYITREYPADWHPGDEPYYPLNNERNADLYQRYVERSKEDGDIVFAGRLGGYQYYDMDKCIDAAFDLVENELGVNFRV